MPVNLREITTSKGSIPVVYEFVVSGTCVDSGQRFDLYKRICCRGNVFYLAVFLQWTFLLCFSECTLPAFKGLATICFEY
jgi:hypothetical protein